MKRYGMATLLLIASACGDEPTKPPPGHASLTLINAVINNNNGGFRDSAWTLVANGPTPFSGPGHTVSDSALSAGAYVLSISGPAGYRASDWVCSGGVQSGNTITLGSDDRAVCRISHDDMPPKLTLVKVVTNDDGGVAQPSDFVLYAQGQVSFEGPGVATSDVDFFQGVYTLREGGPSGYTAGAWSCTGATATGDPPVVSLTLGQVATCTSTSNDVAATRTTYYVDDPGDFQITTDLAPAGLSAGDIVTFSPTGGRHSAVAGLTFGTNAFAKIQDAIDAVSSAYDVIRVAGGTFAEQVRVNKSVVLLGNQYGVDARQRPGTAGETVLTGSSGSTSFSVTAGDVTIDGFTVQDATNAANAGAGIVIGYVTSGTNVRNNIIKDNITGLYIANFNNSPWTVIQQNVFRSNNRPGPTGGVGVYCDSSTTGGTRHFSMLIDNNSFLDHTGAAAIVLTTNTEISNVTISNNLFDHNAGTLVARRLHFWHFTGNESRNSTRAAGAELRLVDGVFGLNITRNILAGSGQTGSRAVQVSSAGNPAGAIVFELNSISGYDSAAVELDAGAYTNKFDAKYNWWGASIGPNGLCNLSGLGGAGQRIIDQNLQVDCQPFLTSGTDSDSDTPGFQPPGFSALQRARAVR